MFVQQGRRRDGKTRRIGSRKRVGERGLTHVGISTLLVRQDLTTTFARRFCSRFAVITGTLPYSTLLVQYKLDNKRIENHWHFRVCTESSPTQWARSQDRERTYCPSGTCSGSPRYSNSSWTRHTASSPPSWLAVLVNNVKQRTA